MQALQPVHDVSLKITMPSGLTEMAPAGHASRQAGTLQCRQRRAPIHSNG